MIKYVKHFLKNRLLIAFVSSTLFFALFFFVLLYNRSAIYAPFYAFLIYIPALIWYAFDVLLTLRFHRQIKYQEQRYNIAFNDTNAVALFPKSNAYLSDDWLIFSGKAAFYKPYIKRITIIAKQTNMGNDYYLQIYTDDGKVFTRMIDSHVSAKTIQQWYKNS